MHCLKFLDLGNLGLQHASTVLSCMLYWLSATWIRTVVPSGGKHLTSVAPCPAAPLRAQSGPWPAQNHWKRHDSPTTSVEFNELWPNISPLNLMKFQCIHIDTLHIASHSYTQRRVPFMSSCCLDSIPWLSWCCLYLWSHSTTNCQAAKQEKEIGIWWNLALPVQQGSGDDTPFEQCCSYLAGSSAYEAWFIGQKAMEHLNDRLWNHSGVPPPAHNYLRKENIRFQYVSVKFEPKQAEQPLVSQQLNKSVCNFCEFWRYTDSPESPSVIESEVQGMCTTIPLAVTGGVTPRLGCLQKWENVPRLRPSALSPELLRLMQCRPRICLIWGNLHPRGQALSHLSVGLWYTNQEAQLGFHKLESLID